MRVPDYAKEEYTTFRSALVAWEQDLDGADSEELKAAVVTAAKALNEVVQVTEAGEANPPYRADKVQLAQIEALNQMGKGLAALTDTVEDLTREFREGRMAGEGKGKAPAGKNTSKPLQQLQEDATPPWRLARIEEKNLDTSITDTNGTRAELAISDNNIREKQKEIAREKKRMKHYEDAINKSQHDLDTLAKRRAMLQSSLTRQTEDQERSK